MALRQRFIDNVLLCEKVEHVGRHNRLFGWRCNIVERLIALGRGSKIKILPLLEHPSGAVRLAAAHAVKPFDRPLFMSTLVELAGGLGKIAQEARSGLDQLKWQDENPSTAAPSDDPPLDPSRRRILDWQDDNPPPPAISRGQFEDRLLTQFSTERARQILAFARPAIGLWPQRHDGSRSPLATRRGGQPWAPQNWTWPLYQEEPLCFLGHIRCPDLAGLPGAERLPKEGVIAFFGDFDVITGCSPGGKAQQGAVYHWTEEPLFPATPPLPLDASPQDCTPIPLVLRPFIDVPDPAADIIGVLGLNDAETERYQALRENLRYHGIPEEMSYYGDLDSKILGWPDLV